MIKLNLKIMKVVIFISSILFLLLFQNNNYIIVKNSITAFLGNVMPSLFPFILFTNIIVGTNIIDSLTSILKKNSYLLSLIIIGFLCGFPMGARATYKYYEEEKIVKKDATYLMKFINNCNPIFIISTIGICVFDNIKIGILLAISHYVSAIIIGIFSYKSCITIIHENKIKSNSLEDFFDKKLHKTTFFDILDKSIKNTFVVLSSILGYIIIFNILFGFLNTLMQKMNISINIISFISSIFEVTNGTNMFFLNSTFDRNIIISIISFSLGFSGLSIIFQIYSCIYNLKIPLAEIIKYKFIHGILSFLITYTFINLLQLDSINSIDFIKFSEPTYYLIATSILYLFIFTIKKVTHKLDK